MHIATWYITHVRKTNRSLIGHHRYTRRSTIPESAYVSYNDALLHKQDPALYRDGADESSFTTFTKYKLLYKDIRRYLRAIDLEVLDAVHQGDERQIELCKKLNLTQSTFSHRYTKAQNVMRTLVSMPPLKGMRRACHHYLSRSRHGRMLPVCTWLYIRCCCFTEVARLTEKKLAGAWGKCNQITIRNKMYTSLRLLAKSPYRDAAALHTLLQWCLEHTLIRHIPRNTHTTLTDWNKGCSNG